MIDDGQILLSPPGRPVLPIDAADDLLLRPTLSWLVDSPRAVTTDAEITYLSGGLSWEADYVLVLSADDKLGDFDGMVTLSNYSGTTYNDAELKLVAGDVHLVPEVVLKDIPQSLAVEEVAGRDGPAFVEEELFEYHLYDLQRPTTIRNSQQKQIGLLSATGVPLKKLYVFDGIDGGSVQVWTEFVNDEESSFGVPLPKGTVRIFKPDSEGSLQFIREHRINHTARNETVKLYVGDAFDIVGEKIQTDYSNDRGVTLMSYKVKLKNRKKSGEAVVVTVPVSVYGDWKVLSASHDYVKKDAWTIEFSVTVPADSTTELTWTYEETSH